MKKATLIAAYVSIFCALGTTAEAASLKVTANCFTGTEQLSHGDTNRLSVCTKGSKIVLSEEVNGDKLLTITDSHDGRPTDGNLSLTLSNGDQLIVTSGYNPTMTVDYILVRGTKRISLKPSVQVELVK